MNKSKLTILVAVAILAVTNFAIAQTVTSVTLRANAIPVDFPSVTLLDLKSRIVLNAKPNKKCTVQLYGSVSKVGNESADPAAVLLATRKVRKNGPRTTRLNYYGRAVNGTEARQTQVNYQARVKCRGEAELISNVVSNNVTCNGGMSKNLFLATLQNAFN